jgi:urease accessory protein UreE
VEFRLTDSARLSIADTARTLIKSSKGKGVTISLKVDVMISRQDILILREKK